MTLTAALSTYLALVLTVAIVASVAAVCIVAVQTWRRDQ